MSRIQARKTAKKVARKTTKKKAAKRGIILVSPTPKRDKNAKHDKKLPVVKIARTDMSNIILNTDGRPFISTHIDKEGKARTMEAIILSDNPQTDLGYINVWSVKDRGYRNIDPRTLTDLSYNDIHFKL